MPDSVPPPTDVLPPDISVALHPDDALHSPSPDASVLLPVPFSPSVSPTRADAVPGAGVGLESELEGVEGVEGMASSFHQHDMPVAQMAV